MKAKGFAAKRVFATEKGIHIEFASAREAKECYEDSLSRGITTNELDGLTVIKRFRKKKSINLTQIKLIDFLTSVKYGN